MRLVCKFQIYRYNLTRNIIFAALKAVHLLEKIFKLHWKFMNSSIT